MNPNPEPKDTSDYIDEKILADKKILIVGAGGLGCELLKLLVINGFKQISIIDMDKIERSNLNRQFLFDHSSIGKYKSEIAVKKIYEYRQDPTLKIESYIGNIKDEDKFGTKFYSNFDLILNGLDNNDARYYINSVCVKLNIPFINSGSEGIYGMVNWHIRGITPCFACKNIIKDEDVIPICSIRLKPEKLDHCVAWGKVLFEQIFISNNPSNDNEEDNKDKEKLFDKNMPKKSDNFSDIFNYTQYMFFNSINEYKELMDTNKDNNNNKETTNKKNGNDKVHPLDVFKLLEINCKDGKCASNDITEEKTKNYLETYTKFKFDINLVNVQPDEKNISEITKLFIIFISSYYTLSKRPSIYEFDKEDDDIINFIYSATNLRCYNFSLNLESKFKIKEIAGKIIAAIAYTNNIISSVEVLEAKKYFLKKNERDKFLKNWVLGYGYNLVSNTAINSSRNVNCPICSDEVLKEAANMKCYETEINFEKEKLNNLLEGIKENILKLNEDKNININVEMNKNLIYTEGIGLEEDEMEEFDENKNKNINEFMIKDKTSNNKKEADIIVSTWNDKFEENSKKCYSIKIKNCIIDSTEVVKNIKFKEMLLGQKRKRSEN